MSWLELQQLFCENEDKSYSQDGRTTSQKELKSQTTLWSYYTSPRLSTLRLLITLFLLKPLLLGFPTTCNNI